MHAAGLLWRRLTLLMPFIALMLAGCYETDMALIDNGDKADIAGKHTCRLLVGDKEDFGLTITEAAPGTYRFAAPDVAGTVKLKRLQSGRYLLQLADDEYPGIFYYAYGEATSAAGFRTLYPNRDDKAVAAAAMKKHAVHFYNAMGREDATGATVKAEPAELMRFLADPSVHELKPWFTCERT